jgi:mRNA-degrading endonuclease RelE of RelBE toxin-antitoxin system
MKIKYSRSFIHDLKKLKHTIDYPSIKSFCFDKLETYRSVAEIIGIRKIAGYENYYRIRVGHYRIGIRLEGDDLILKRILHRKEIYRFFP